MALKVVFFGTPSFVVPVLEALMKNFDVLAVVTTPDQKSGRKQLLTPTPVKQFALMHNEKHASLKTMHPLQIYTPEKLDTVSSPAEDPLRSEARLWRQLAVLKPDLFVVAAYGQILSQEVLTIPPFGAVNVHPSLLPKFRGPTPVPSTLLGEDTTIGVTLIKMDQKMDHGPILAMRSYQIHETDTTATLLEHLFTLSAEMLPDVITNYTNGKIEPEPQDESKATYTKKITKQDGLINLKNPPGKATLEKMIRAYYPWPTVWTKLQMTNGSWKVIKFLPGKKIQMEGKNPVNAKDFINGYPELQTQMNEILEALA